MFGLFENVINQINLYLFVRALAIDFIFEVMFSFIFILLVHVGGLFFHQLLKL
jgi:hypothetical protein